MSSIRFPRALAAASKIKALHLSTLVQLPRHAAWFSLERGADPAWTTCCIDQVPLVRVQHTLLSTNGVFFRKDLSPFRFSPNNPNVPRTYAAAVKGPGPTAAYSTALAD